MNWYKKAQRKSRLQELLKGFSRGALIGLIGWLGMNSIASLHDSYAQNPQKIEQKIIEYQNSNMGEEQNFVTEFANNIPANNVGQEPNLAAPQSLESSPEYGFNMQRVSDMIREHEGVENVVYKDTKKIPTIGIGFNLNRSDAREKIEGIGADYDKIRSGKRSLSDQQIEYLFQISLKESIETARNFISNFDEQPVQVQEVLIDMSFNLGQDKLYAFNRFRKALIEKDYSLAAQSMEKSLWYRQVGNRSKELVDIIRNI